jgi:uncharacterized protein (DUF2141 family)
MAWNRISAVLTAVLLAEAAHAQGGVRTGTQTGATLVIHVQGVSPKGGILRLGLYDAASYPDDKSEPAASADVPAHGGETVVSLHNLRPGTYAIQAYQDLNSNDKMDTTWIGIPEEPFGFPATPGRACPSPVLTG